jgi:hypothetical protein
MTAIVSFDWGGYRYTVTLSAASRDPYGDESITLLMDSLMTDLSMLLRVMTDDIWDGEEVCLLHPYLLHQEDLQKNVEILLARRIGQKMLSLLSRSDDVDMDESIICNPQEEA